VDASGWRADHGRGALSTSLSRYKTAQKDIAIAKKPQIKTILIVEDDTAIRKFAARVLELEGYRVLQAEHGDAGLRLARSIRVDLILLDLRMPERDGWSVLEEVKSDMELMAIPVVVFTASVAESQREKALRMGAANYLVKPMSAASLNEAVTHILRCGR
jgi:DNA-binding response OmpR family regulator